MCRFHPGRNHGEGRQGIYRNALETDKETGETVSKISAQLRPGAPVTLTRTDVMYVATEYGVVDLKGKSFRERAHALISIAHPDFRGELINTPRTSSTSYYRSTSSSRYYRGRRLNSLFTGNQYTCSIKLPPV